MALIMFEGFEGMNESSINILEGWTQSGLGNSVESGGRNGGRCMKTPYSGITSGATYTFPAPIPQLYTGVAINIPRGNGTILSLAGQASLHKVGVNYVMHLGASTGNPVLGTIPNVLGGWSYIEIGYLTHPTAGRCILRLNGATVSDFTGNTRASGTLNAISSITYQGPDTTDRSFDDIYIVDGEGSPNNFLGDCKVVALYPNGNGNSSQGTGSDGDSTDNYLLVDEPLPSTTDYVDLSIGEKDTYAYSNHGLSTGIVGGVQLRSVLSKTDVGAVRTRSVARLGGTEAYGSDFYPPFGSYVYIQTTWTTRPTGGAWTLADLDNAEFGLEGRA